MVKKREQLIAIHLLCVTMILQRREGRDSSLTGNSICWPRVWLRLDKQIHLPHSYV